MFESRSKSLGDGSVVLYAWFPSMHTRVDIAIKSSLPENTVKAVVGSVQQLLSNLERIGNKFDPCSELSFVNRQASIEPVKVSRILFDMLSLCLDYNAYTLGYFDVCAAPYQPSAGTSCYIDLNGAEQTVFFKTPGVSIDLSGFLKGYALDLIRLYLEEVQLDNVFVSFGTSSVMAIGPGPEGNGWPITIPEGEDTFFLHDSFFTTSGNNTDERTHILIPRSGELVEGKGMVSVETTCGWAGEMLSTALFSAKAKHAEEQILWNVKNNKIVSKLIKSVQM